MKFLGYTTGVGASFGLDGNFQLEALSCHCMRSARHEDGSQEVSMKM